MKRPAALLATILYTLTIHSVSHAEIKPPGTILSAYCADTLTGKVTEVCFAHKVGVSGSYLTVKDSSGLMQVYQIAAEREITTAEPTNVVMTELTLRLELLIMPNGQISIPFNPEQHTLIQSQDFSGDLKSLTLQGIVSGSTEIKASDFEIMFHTL